MTAPSTSSYYVLAVGQLRTRVCGVTASPAQLRRVVHDLNWLLAKRRQLCGEVYHGQQEPERLQRLHACTEELRYLDPDWAFYDEPLRYEAGGVHSYERCPPRHPPAGRPVPPPEGQPDYDEISLGVGGPCLLGRGAEQC